MVDAQCPFLELAVWYPNTYSHSISVALISVSIAYLFGELRSPKKSKKYISKCLLLR